MSFWDSVKEFFGGAHEHVQDTQEHVNLEDLQQKAQDVGQNVAEKANEVGEQVGQKVEEVKEKLPGQDQK